MCNISEDRIARQIEIENMATANTAEKYTQAFNSFVKKGRGSETVPGRDFVYTFVEPLIDLLFDEIERRLRGLSSTANEFIASLPPDVIAYISIRHLIDGAMNGDLIIKRATMLAEDLEDQANAIKLQWKDSGAYAAMMNRIQKCAVKEGKKEIRKKFLKRWYKAVIDPVQLSRLDRDKAGLTMLHMASLVASKFIEIVPFRLERSKHTSKILTIKESLLDHVQDRNKMMSMSSPQYPIFVIPPKDWTSVFSGPYYTGEMNRRAKFIRSWDKSYLRHMESRKDEFTGLIDAVNKAQHTAWIINSNILGVVEGCIKLGAGERWALPIINKKDLPVMKHLDRGSKEFKEAQKVRRQMLSHYITFQGQVETARQYANEGEIYFGYAVDTRSRGYAVYGGRFISPQGNDLSKAFLCLSKGEQLGSQEAADWLLYGAANAYGIDDVPREERIRWAASHMDLMVDCANDPYESDNRKFWTNADKPWQFLAFCFEVKGYAIHGLKHVTRIIVHQDGCQNALQHVAGMMKDEDLAVRCSVVNDIYDRPRDLYKDVAKRAEDLLEQRLKLDRDKRKTDVLYDLGKIAETKMKDKGEDSRKWLKRLREIDKVLMPRLLAGRNLIGREITKSPVMTFTYDVSTYTRKDQISDGIIKLQKKVPGYGITEDFRWRAVQYLEPVIYKATCDILPGAAQYLEWLKSVIAVLITPPECSKCDKCNRKMCDCKCSGRKIEKRRRRMSCACRTGVLSAEWTTPLGFPVIQRKVKKEVALVETIIGKYRVTSSVATETKAINNMAMLNGIAANFTHSYDATMLWEVVRQTYDKIPSIALVHDSYGTLPTHSGILAEVLRKVYVTMYSTCHLSRFRAGVVKILADSERKDLIDSIPELPKPGKLDISNALSSNYIFS